MNLKEFLNTPIRRMIARNIALALVVGICLLFVMLRDSRRMYGETVMFSTMSTVGSVTLNHKEKMVVKNALAAAHEAIREVEKTCNIFDPESELAKLNASAADEPFACSDLLWDVLTQARNFYRDSGGAFDVTIDPLMKLWGFHSKRETLPSAEEIAEAKRLAGLDKVLFDDGKRTVKFLSLIHI